MVFETLETTVWDDDDKNDDIANYTSDAMTKSNLLFGPRPITPPPHDWPNYQIPSKPTPFDLQISSIYLILPSSRGSSALHDGTEDPREKLNE
jgi:hypothetical protein